MASTEVPTERATFSSTLSRLSGAQKPKHGPYYTVYVNRAFGRRIAAAAHLLGLSPNQVTAISSVITFAGIAALALGTSSVATALGVAVLLAVGFAFDSADGQLARLGSGGSLTGEWLDHTVDSVKIVALHSAVAIHLHRATDLGAEWQLVPLGFAAVNVGSFCAMVLSEQLQRNVVGPGPRPPAEPASLARSLSLLPADYGTLCWVFVLLVWPDAFLAAYGFLFVAAAAHLAVAARRRFRELAALDEQRRATPVQP